MRENYGGYGDIFKGLLENGAAHLAQISAGKKAELEITKYDVVDNDKYPLLEDVDAILLTGSSKFPLQSSFKMLWQLMDAWLISHGALSRVQLV